MTKKHSTKRSLIASILILCLCFTSLIGTTFAWFTDSVTSANNVIKTGNLDIKAEYTLDGETWNDFDGAADLFQKGAWEPGHTEVVAIRITNVGSLALKYKVNMNIVEEIVGKSVQGNDIILSDILKVSTLTQQTGMVGDITVALAFNGENKVAYENTASFKDSNVLKEEKELAPDAAHYLVVKVDMPETVGNEANHDGTNKPSIEFGIDILATQFTAESDSFGNGYDEDALYQNSVSATIEGSETIAVKDVAVTLPDGMAEGNYTLTVGNKSKQVTTDNKAIISMDIDLLKDNEKIQKQDGVAYTLSINVGQNLVISKVMHKDVEITDYKYDATAGIVTFKTDSFSPYSITADLNKISATSAQELKDAMLVRGANIALNEDIVVDASTPLQWGAYMFVANGREVTIDLNGHDIIVENDALLQTKAVFTTANGGTLNIVGDGAITIKNGKSGIFHAMNKNDQINVYGGTYVSNSDNGSDALAIMYTNSGNIDVYGGKFCPLDGVQCANAEDIQGNRLSIVFHEGAMLKTELYQKGDSTRIQLAEGCYLKNVQIHGEEWWQVTKKQENIEYSSDYSYIALGYGSSSDYVLDGNLTADNYLFFGDNTSNTIDLNGKTVDATGGFLFVTDGENCSMTIDGNGTVNVDAGYAGYASNSGSRNINGGTFMLGETSNKAHLYSQNSATIVINDGEFISTDANTPIVYCINGFVEINGGFFQNTANPDAALLNMGNNLNYVNNQKITLSGGTFVNWNPVVDSAFAYDWPQCPALIVLADGYQMISETQANGDVWYTVVPE